MKLDDPGTNFTSITWNIWNQPQFDQCSKNIARIGNPIQKQKEYPWLERTGTRQTRREFKLSIVSKQFPSQCTYMHSHTYNSDYNTNYKNIWIYRQSKLRALVTNIAMQRIKAVEATEVSDMLCTCKTQWYIMRMLIIITLGMLYLVTNKLRKWSFFKGHLFFNNTKILLFISKTHSYVPIKLCRVVRSIHLFRIEED